MRGALIALVLFAACQTPHPTGAPFAPITAATPDQALRELNARSAELPGARSLMHIRVITPSQTQSFNAQLQLDPHAMALIAYTPFNTTALRIYADEHGVLVINDLQHTVWHGSPREFSGKVGLFGDVAPRDMAKLLIGLPASSSISYEATNAGLARAHDADVTITYDPPSFPPSRVTIARGTQRVEVEQNTLVVSTEKVEPLVAPAEYKTTS